LTCTDGEIRYDFPVTTIDSNAAVPLSDGAPAPHPSFHHPLASALTALQHAHIYVDIAVVVVVLALTNLIAHFTTPWANIVTVPAAAVGLLMLVRSRGLGWSELGLGRDSWRSGILYGLGAFALVATVVAIGALLPWTRPMFLNDHYATLSGALIASMLIIPLQTVIPEELAFRGVLHGALARPGASAACWPSDRCCSASGTSPAHWA